MQINPKKLNPLGFHLLKLLQDATIRLIILFGGSSSGKSYSVAQLILIMTLWDCENTLVMRKVGASISKSIYEDFKVAAKQLGIFRMFKFRDGVRQVLCLTNGAKIDFGGLDDPEKIKGISNYKRVVLDEWSEFESEDFKQVRKRLRGKAGQQIITTFNPIKETHWIKKEIFDVEKWHDIPMDVEIAGQKIPSHLTAVKSIRMNEAKSILNPRTKEVEVHAPDTVIIQSTYLNNFWVVGSPDGTYGYYDEQCIADFEKDRINDPDYYNVYALGEWGVLRTGSEFFGSFNRGAHTAEVSYNPDLPIHLSIDSNVMPYISVQYWQAIIGDKTTLWQFDETCAASPDNSARKSAKLVAKRLLALSPSKVHVHGDASTRAANTIDDDKRSFLDLFIGELQKEGIDIVDCVGTKNPSVPMSGEFINAIYDGVIPSLSITIGENCKNSIEDYMSVQKDANGAILKTKVKNKITGQTYEEHGHLSDCKRYVVTDILREQFLAFSNRRKRNLYAKDGAIQFYNPSTDCTYTENMVYCMPNINGKFVLLFGNKCGEYWHVTHVRFIETTSTEDMKVALTGCNSNHIVLECSKSYYLMARDLRDSLSGDVRVLHESTDLARRIAATSDYVKSNIRFNETELNDNIEYGQFMTNLLDYNRDASENIEASAVLSGFIQTVLKLDL